MQNSSVVLYPLLLFCLAKFSHIIRTASIFFRLFFSAVVELWVLLPKSRFILGVLFLVFLLNVLSPSPDSSFPHLFPHTRTHSPSPVISPHPRHSSIYIEPWHCKRFYKNWFLNIDPYGFVLTFIVNALTIQNNPFALRTHIRHQTPKGLVLLICYICPWFGVYFSLFVFLFFLEPPFHLLHLWKKPKTQLIFDNL